VKVYYLWIANSVVCIIGAFLFKTIGWINCAIQVVFATIAIGIYETLFTNYFKRLEE